MKLAGNSYLSCIFHVPVFVVWGGALVCCGVVGYFKWVFMFFWLWPATCRVFCSFVRGVCKGFARDLHGVCQGFGMAFMFHGFRAKFLGFQIGV